MDQALLLGLKKVIFYPIVGYYGDVHHLVRFAPNFFDLAEQHTDAGSTFIKSRLKLIKFVTPAAHSLCPSEFFFINRVY